MILYSVYRCDWCEHSEEYDKDSQARAAEDGWIVVDKHPETELTFCSPECLISYL